MKQNLINLLVISQQRVGHIIIVTVCIIVIIHYCNFLQWPSLALSLCHHILGSSTVSIATADPKRGWTAVLLV